MQKLFSRAKKAAIGGVAALTLVGSLAASSVPADAAWGRHGGRHHGHNGGAVAAGIIGGLALGALAGNAWYGPGYYGYAPAYGPGCYVRDRVFVNRWGHRVVRQVQVCP